MGIRSKFVSVLSGLVKWRGWGSIGSAVGTSLKGIGKAFSKIKWPAIKIGGFGAAFTGAVWGIKEFVGNVFQAASDLIHDTVKSVTGVDLSSGSSNMILAATLCAAVVGITVLYLRRGSRR